MFCSMPCRLAGGPELVQHQLVAGWEGFEGLVEDLDGHARLSMASGSISHRFDTMRTPSSSSTSATT